MYKTIIRPILFCLSPETAHNLIFKCLGLSRRLPFVSTFTRWMFKKENRSLHREVFGIDFPNPVGLAAGLDKNGEYYNQLSDFGFSFIEIGSLTPEPQPGNPKPRLFRVPRDKAIINHMGINNKGVKNALLHIQKDSPRVILAASLAKSSKSLSDAEILRDYTTSFSLMYDFVDMFVINISCPNVHGMTALEDITYLSDILDELLRIRMSYDSAKPILIKLSPDIDREQMHQILDYAMLSGIDGVVASNTTRSREGLTISETRIKAIGEGGLSGAPLYEKSLSLVKDIHAHTKGRLPIIGVGGIMTPLQAQEMLDAGASLIEIYSGFIYNGPSFIRKILRTLEHKSK